MAAVDDDLLSVGAEIVDVEVCMQLVVRTDGDQLGVVELPE